MKPSEKQIKFAESLAARHGVEIDAKCYEDFDACRDFIDKHNKPTSKQIDLVKKITN